MPLPKGYTLDQPAKLPAGYKLDSPQQVVKPYPTETIGPMSTMNQLTQIRPITSQMSLPDKAETFLSNIGGGGLGVLLHPVDTAVGIGKSLLNPAATLKGTYDAANTRPMETLSSGIGQTAALGGLTEGAKVLAPKVSATPAGAVMRNVGRGLQDAGAGVINKTVGSLQSDFKRGANPGAAYLDAGGGPALSISSLATKGAALKGQVGRAIGSAVSSASKNGVTLTPQEVMSAMSPAIRNATDLELGPGGMKNVQPIHDYASSFTPAFEDATKNGGFTPNTVFDMKDRIAKGTNWSDATQAGLKPVRQQNVGALGGLLESKIPELKELNPQYQGLTKFSKRALTRAETHSMPLTSLAFKTGTAALGAGTGMLTGHPIAGALAGAAIDSVPFKTTLGYGLYQGGRGVGALGNGLLPVPRLYPPALGIAANGLKNDSD